MDGAGDPAAKASEPSSGFRGPKKSILPSPRIASSGIRAVPSLDVRIEPEQVNGRSHWGIGTHYSLASGGWNTPVYVGNAIEQDVGRALGSSGNTMIGRREQPTTPYSIGDGELLSKRVHVRLFKDWAWLVSDRKLMIWNHTAAVDEVRMGPSCYYELKLPPTGLVNRADLIDVFVSPEENRDYALPSCLVVSPEGRVIYWPCIGAGHSSIELNLDLSGQECEALIPMWPEAALLLTTSGNVILLIPRADTFPVEFEQRPLRMAQGFFSGVRRRISAMFSHAVEQGVQRIVRVAGGRNQADPSFLDVYVLIDSVLKRWRVNPAPGGLDDVVFEYDVDKILKSAYREHFGLAEQTEAGVCTWILDMASTKTGIVFLTAGTRLQEDSHTIVLSLALLDVTDSSAAPEEFTQFRHLPREEALTTDFESALSCYRLLRADGNLVVYHPRFLCCVSLDDRTGRRTTVLEADGDIILGHGLTGPAEADSSSIYIYSKVYGSMKVLRNYGIDGEVERGRRGQQNGSVAMPNERRRRTRFLDQSLANQSSAESVADVESSRDVFESSIDSNSSLLSATGSSVTVRSQRRLGGKSFMTVPKCTLENMRVSDDMAIKLKAAVLHYALGEEVAAREIVENLLPLRNITSWAGNLDAVVDQVVIRCSRENILDDYPTQDPRWRRMDCGPGAGGLSCSMMLTTQIKDKKLVHDLFLEFLSRTQLMEVLATVSSGSRIQATRHMLAEDAEKIIVADIVVESRKLLGSMFDQMMGLLLSGVENLRSLRISRQDIFFRKLTDVGRFFTEGVRDWQKSVAAAGGAASDPKSVKYLLATAKLTEVCLSAVAQFRASCPDLITIAENADYHWEYVPWTALPEFREFLKQQIDLCLDYCAAHPQPSTVFDYETAVALNSALKVMVDFLLDGYIKQLDSMPPGARRKMLDKEFASVRFDCLDKLRRRRSTEEFAWRKAEEYFDFDQLCERTYNYKGLEPVPDYVETFKERDFAGHAFKWLLSRKRNGEAVTLALRADSLESTIKDYPDLYWMYLGKRERNSEAMVAVYNLAKCETTIAKRKRYMLSAAKMFLNLALKERMSDEATVSEQRVWDDINRESDILEIQERIPSSVLDAFGLKSFHDGGPPLRPSDIIQMYGQSEGSSASMFLDAFRATTLIDDDESEVHKYRRYLWWSAVKKDDWKTLPDDPLAIKNTFLYAVAEEVLSAPSMKSEVRIACFSDLLDLVGLEEIPEIKEHEEFGYKLGLAFEIIAGDFHVSQSDPSSCAL